VEFDLFWKELNELLKKQKSKTLVIYLSDHGEAVGRGGRWGHGFLGKYAFEVPMIIQTFNQDLPKRTFELPKYLTHYNLALFTTNQIGWQTNQNPYTVMQDFVIYGNDIDGFAGKAQVKFLPNQDYEINVIP
jgi:glucan phosphoethanolaminetransferase (alkaline phosphatase superfamily)